MKHIFITVSEASVTRNLLRGTFWKYFGSGADFLTVLLVPINKKNEYEKEFGGKNVIVEGFPNYHQSVAEKLTALLARNALKTGTTTMNQMRQFVDGGGRGGLLLKRFLWHVFGDSSILRQIVRIFELQYPPTAEIRRLFNLYRPSLIFSTITIHAEMDVPILREAKRRRIPTVGMLRGWDNFTTHGFLRIVPDKMLLQNQYLKEMGIKHQGLKEDMMEVVGFPQNDWYFRKDLVEPRAKFLARLGVDSKKRIILYGAMGDYLFPMEGEIAESFEELVESGKIPRDLIMIFRAHPAFPSPLEKMKNLRYVIPDRKAIYREAGKFQDWEMGEQEMAYLINSIVHSEMVITSGSTMALDAVALGKPAISVAFEKTPMPYWLSSRRFRHHYTHYQDMMATGGVRQADSPEDLAYAIKEYLEDPSRDELGRRNLREKFLEPYDGHSGERIAKILVKMLS
jgi:hypothetical protein